MARRGTVRRDHRDRGRGPRAAAPGRALAPGGVLVIPVGEPFSVQLLLLVRKHENGEVSVRQILPVRFVPLTGGH